MPDGSAPADKQDKKQAKAAAKAAKKQAKAEAKRAATQPSSEPPRVDAPATGNSTDGNSTAERSARAAEEKVRLERWRVVFGAVGALIALITLAVMLQRGCGQS